jgi:thioredoxin reductase
MHDLIILGGGPAGLTATIYALRKRLNVLLVSPVTWAARPTTGSSCPSSKGTW